MTSALGGGGGPQKTDKKEQNHLICDSDKGGGGQKSENVADLIHGSPLSAFLPHLGLLPALCVRPDLCRDLLLVEHAEPRQRGDQMVRVLGHRPHGVALHLHRVQLGERLQLLQ